jgi:Domain of unknown function (DUF4388)
MIPQVIAATFTRDSLPDVLRNVAQRGESGQLTLSSRSLRAIVHFEHGTLIGARFGTNAGEEAFMRILALEVGTCNFEAGRASATVTINRPLEHLLASAYVSERLTQEPVPITERTVLSSREAEASKPVNLMRIHWQIIKHVDGERSLGQISELVGLTVQQLERPVRDLTVAGLIGVDNTRPALSQTSSGHTTSSHTTSIKAPVVSDPVLSSSEPLDNSSNSVSSTSERKRTLFGMFSRSTQESDAKVSSEKPRSNPFTLERLLPPTKPDQNSANLESITSESKRSSITETKRSAVRDSQASHSTASHSTSARRIDISSEYIDSEFIGFLRKRLAVFIGPMAEFALEDAADALGASLEKIKVEKLEHFIELLVQEVMPERQAEFHAQVGPLVQRYASRINR